MQQSSSIPVTPPHASDPLPPINTSGSSDNWRGIISTVAILVAAPLVALLLTAFIFQSYEVDGQSMETTLQHQDRLIIWKAPRTLSRITGNGYIPHRADVIVFVKHGLYEAGSAQERQLIKRVIGLPGDRVVVQDGRMTVFNAEHPDGYNPDLNHDFSHNIASLTTGNLDLVVPEGQVFVAGDNRTNSQDSRSFGPISVDDIVGKLTVRIFPVSSFKSFI